MLSMTLKSLHNLYSVLPTQSLSLLYLEVDVTTTQGHEAILSSRALNSTLQLHQATDTPSDVLWMRSPFPCLRNMQSTFYFFHMCEIKNKSKGRRAHSHSHLFSFSIYQWSVPSYIISELHLSCANSRGG
jgi:hypothetical protein